VILHEIRRASHHEELDHGSLRIETGDNPGLLSPPDLKDRQQGKNNLCGEPYSARIPPPSHTSVAVLVLIGRRQTS
jgi:hypothetical protein